MGGSYQSRAIDVVLHKGEDGEIYNSGGECEIRNINIVNIIKEKLGGEIEYVEDRKGHDWRYAMNISKIKKELGWKPKIKFEEAIKELING